MKNIKTLQFREGAFPTSYQRFCYKIENGIMNLSANTQIDNENDNIYRECKIDEKVYSLIDDIIKDWNEEYSYKDVYPNIEICDGFTWSLDIIYEDGTEKHSSGHEHYPDNFDDLIKCLNDALGIDVDLSFD